MTSSLTLLFKKYSVPALFIMAGLTMVIIGFKTSQNMQYTIATIMMLIAGILSFLYSSGKFSTTLLTVLGAVAGVASVVILYLSFNSVAATKAHMDKYDLCFKKAIANLTDIRAAQKAYSEKTGKYAASWEELLDFVKNGEVPSVDENGAVPSRTITVEERKFLYGDNRAIDNKMTEIEAYRLSKSPNPAEDLIGFKRDTVLVSFMSTKFGAKSYVNARINNGLGKFYADSMITIPMSGGKKWKLEVKDSVQVNDDFFPAICVSGKLPLAKIEGEKTQEISFGKITTNDTSGSWEK